MEKSPKHPVHKLSDNWTLWAHLPNDNNWSLKSYSEVFTFKHIEELMTLNNTIPERMLSSVVLPQPEGPMIATISP